MNDKEIIMQMQTLGVIKRDYEGIYRYLRDKAHEIGYEITKSQYIPGSFDVWEIARKPHTLYGYEKPHYQFLSIYDALSWCIDLYIEVKTNE